MPRKWWFPFRLAYLFRFAKKNLRNMRFYIFNKYFSYLCIGKSAILGNLFALYAYYPTSLGV